MPGNTFYITARHMVPSVVSTHNHVGSVKLSSGTELARDQVFSWMANGEKFKTLAPNGASADVVRVTCRSCGSSYLRTDRDNTKTDNLDELPEF